MLRPAPIAILLLLACIPLDCYAYVDPNAGGILFQLLAPVLAAVVGGWMFLRRWTAAVLRRVWHAVIRWSKR